MMKYFLLILSFLVGILLPGCSSQKLSTNLPHSNATSTFFPTSLSILTSTPTTTSTYSEKDDVLREKFDKTTPSPSPTLRPTMTITPNVDLHLYANQWSTYFDQSLNISFEYPKLYDFPVPDQFYGELWCNPKKIDNRIHVSDWIAIIIENISETGKIPSFDDYHGQDWSIESEKYIEVDGIDTLLITARKIAYTDNNGNSDYYQSLSINIVKNNISYFISYESVPMGIWHCASGYHLDDKNIFLHILETFKIYK